MAPLRVLIIDDNEAQCSGLAELLEMSGYVTEFALTGMAGVSSATERPPDAVLLDVNLPDISGYEVCRRIGGTPACAGTAIIFHTGSKSTHAHTADAFLTYPVEMAALKAVIQGCVSKRRAARRSPEGGLGAASGWMTLP